jgi:Mlc titration factor MtfA (ptsG expression regulator)
MLVAAAAIVVAGVAVLAWLLLAPWLRSRKRRAAARSGLEPAAIDALSRHVVLRARLPDAIRARFDGRVAAFLAEKHFVGCNGLEVTDEIKTAIAGHACSLLIGRPHGLYEALRSVLVYPTPFWVDEEIHEDGGLVTQRRHVLSGQAWDSSRIILSWEDILETTNHPGSGYNVVVHECAHYFDAEAEPPVVQVRGRRGVRGQVGERPPDSDVSDADELSWHDALDREYERLVDAVDDDAETFLDPYAAEDPAEFFAVASEEFVDRPGPFQEAEPALYALLRAYYGFDPAAWDSASPPLA